MADKKISQLALASTPLSGGETLPIVQTGATVQVSVTNLTAGRGISATSVANGLGAVGTPSYTFTGDTNTGMWSPAANTVAVSTDGSECLRVTASGDVGIGTSTPANRLAVQDNTAPTFFDTTLDNTAFLICNRGAGIGNFGASLGFSRLDSSGRVNAAIAIKQTSADADQCGMSFFTHASAATGVALQESMTITHAGNVGIGTSSPAVPLEVAGDIRSSGLYQRVDNSGLTLSGGTTFNTGGAAIALRGVSSGSNVHGMEFYAGGSERVRINSSGNVGIGTNSPNAAARLDVSSTTSGFLPPRMTEAQRDLIATPPDGLMLYNTTTDKLQVRAAGSWVDLH